MSDPHVPDDGESLDGLGLGSLSDGVRPTPDQWTAISTSASHRRQRRTWLLGVAAVVVLVVGTAAVLLGRSDGDSVTISASGVPADGYVLPPEDATILSAREADGAYAFTYEHDGAFYSLSSMNAGGPTTLPLPDVLAFTYPTVIEPFGTIYLSCAVYESAASTGVTVGTAIDDSEVSQATLLPDRPVTFSGPVTANWLMPTSYMTLRPMSGDDEPCTPPVGADPDLVAALGGLRIGTRSDLDALLGRPISDEPSDVPATVAPAPSVITPTTAAEEPPEDRGSAVEQIAAAVAGFDDRAADGTYPNLEDGTAKAAEYAEMFDTASRQSGATQAGTDEENTSRLSRVRFVTPERASITIEFTATLPTGTYIFPQEGEAILEDGRWVVTYRTVTTTVGRACVPPGGYDGCPAN